MCSQICPVTADTGDVSENKMKKKNEGEKKMAVIFHNVSHLFQRCPCKMMSVSETGIHMMKAHETMGCMVLKERFLCVVSCPL